MEVRENERRYPIGGAKQRALLARLLVARGRPVSVAQLCDELSDDRAPRDPLHALQARVSRLRSLLPKLAIELVGTGYRLDHLRIDTDIARFEKFRDEGGWLLEDGLLRQAADRLREALDLWRGPAFADIPRLPTLQGESARLEKMWASTLADRIDIDLALGNQADLIPELAALVEENPLDERFWGQLLVAMYRDGQVQEALAAYARARTIFSERFGVEPNGELGRIHVGILQEEPSESLLRLPLAHAVLAKPVLTRPDAPPLPRDVSDTRLTSNRTDALTSMLQQRRALLVTGPAGIGKTHLLRSVRAQLEAQRCLAPLLSASNLSQGTPLGVFAGMAGSPSDGWRTAADVIDSLARHRSTTVLLVDNVDLLDDSSLFVVRQLVVTARVPVLIAARTLAEIPETLRSLYDSGDLTEVEVATLSENEATTLAETITGGPLTPDTRRRLLEAAAGSPLRLREFITGSQNSGCLVITEYGWELLGDPVPSARLAQLAGERFDELDAASLEAMSLVAIAGEFPGDALEASQRRALARTGAVKLSDRGWLRLADPMDREVLRARSSELLWHELTREAVQVLTGELAEGMPHAQHRAQLLALGLGDLVDVTATTALAERALGAFDERLALRAAEAVIAHQPDNVDAHRIAGIAASVLRLPDAAEAHFADASRHARTPAESSRVALAHAEHHGLRLHDASRALQIIEHALGELDAAEALHLHRARTRWMAVAGIGGEVALPLELPADVAGVMGLITAAMSGVITGPLDEARRVLAQLDRVPHEVLELVPGGTTLVALTEAMALSYSGDFAATQRLLHKRLDEARTLAPESLGEWEYALGFGELLSGDATRAHTLAVSAVEHLEWRDTSGLLPAAQALRAAASAEVEGHRGADPLAGFDGIPTTAQNDPKVVMLRRWAEARRAHTAGRTADAAQTLVEAARWLLAAQHTYFAGMLAHYAMRTGHSEVAAHALLTEAHEVAGGGLLALLVRHAQSTLTGDLYELDRVARDARELGLTATAADTWASVVRDSARDASPSRLQHHRAAIEQLYAEAPALASWGV
jgi:DNA-binding SARP family transcriptional activator